MRRFDDLVCRVQAALTDDLRQPQYQGSANPMRGHCYVAAESVLHLAGGAASGLKPMNVRHEGESHWFLLGPDGEVVDPTASQFETPVPYGEGRGRGFLTREPSARTREVMRRVGESAKLPAMAKVTKATVERVIRDGAAASLARTTSGGGRTATGHQVGVELGAWVSLTAPLDGYELRASESKHAITQKYPNRDMSIRSADPSKPCHFTIGASSIGGVAREAVERLNRGETAWPVHETLEQFKARLAAVPAGETLEDSKRRGGGKIDALFASSSAPSHVLDALHESQALGGSTRLGDTELSFDAGPPGTTGLRLDLMPLGVTIYKGQAPIDSPSPLAQVWQLATVLSVSACAAHGYLRSGGSLWSAFKWGFMGGFVPIAAPIVALYQGYGQPEVPPNGSAT